MSLSLPLFVSCSSFFSSFFFYCSQGHLQPQKHWTPACVRVARVQERPHNRRHRKKQNVTGAFCLRVGKYEDIEKPLWGALSPLFSCPSSSLTSLIAMSSGCPPHLSVSH